MKYPTLTGREPCLSHDPETFFVEAGDNKGGEQAKAICRTCPTRQPCLEYALSNWRVSGIWGGTSEKERQTIRRRMRDARRAA